MPNHYFTLEALNAAHGDCLLLHYGPAHDPRHIVIDGGPRGVYEAYLAPRLEQIRAARGLDQLTLQHAFVTHLDNDHITGIIDLAKAIEQDASALDCGSFWFNTFADGLTELPQEVAQAQAALGRDDARTITAAVEQASIGEGQTLRDTVARLAASVNDGAGFLIAPEGGLTLQVDPDLTVTLVCPSRRELQKLAKKWIKSTNPSKAETAAYLDQSVFNLSSLVMVVQARGHGKTARMLLTGDARGDHILSGLASAGLLDADGKAHFDLVKIPHHGSDRNATRAFFDDISANHYVLSADGRHDNPSLDVLDWIAASARAPYQVWLTNQSSASYPALQENIATAIDHYPGLQGQLQFRAPDAYSVQIDLLQPIAF